MAGRNSVPGPSSTQTSKFWGAFLTVSKRRALGEHVWLHGLQRVHGLEGKIISAFNKTTDRYGVEITSDGEWCGKKFSFKDQNLSTDRPPSAPAASAAAPAPAPAHAKRKRNPNASDLAAVNLPGMEGGAAKEKLKSCRYRYDKRWGAEYGWLHVAGDRKVKCLCCSEFPHLAPKDKMAQGKCIVATEQQIAQFQQSGVTIPGAIRKDKLTTHDTKHQQAHAAWQAKMNGSGDGSVRSQQLLMPYEPVGVDAQVRLLFLACYQNASMELSNASVGKLGELQRVSGCDILDGYTSNPEYKDIVLCISEVMNESTFERVTGAFAYSLMSDGSQDRGTTEQEIIYSRICDPATMDVHVDFLGLQEIDIAESRDGFSHDAQAIVAAYKSLLEAGGFLDWSESMLAGLWACAASVRVRDKGRGGGARNNDESFRVIINIHRRWC